MTGLVFGIGMNGNSTKQLNRANPKSDMDWSQSGLIKDSSWIDPPVPESYQPWCAPWTHFEPWNHRPLACQKEESMYRMYVHTRREGTNQQAIPSQIVSSWPCRWTHRTLRCSAGVGLPSPLPRPIPSEASISLSSSTNRFGSAPFLPSARSISE